MERVTTLAGAVLGLTLAGMVLGPLMGCGSAPSPIGLDGSGDSSSSDGSEAGTVAADGTTAIADGSGTMGASASATGSSTTSDGSSGGSEADSSSGGEPIDEPLGPFGPPVQVVELGGLDWEDDPTLTGDMLEIYFASTRGGDENIWVSRRDSVDQPWEPPTPVDSLNSSYQETFPEVSTTGTFMLLASNRELTTGLDIYYSWRVSRADPWPAPLPLTSLNTAANDYGATPTPDLSSVFLCRENVQGALSQGDILQAVADFGTWTVRPPALVAELSSDLAEVSVTLSPSEQEIFYETTRPAGLPTDWDLWTATRASAVDPWGEPSPVVELNTPGREQDPWLSPDRRTIYFASDRHNGVETEIYVAHRR